MVLLLLFAAAKVSKAAFELDLTGPRSTGMGGAGVASGGDVWASSRNPAHGSMSEPVMGVCWSQLFGLPELSRENVTAVLPIRSQPIAVRGGNLGTELYRETELSVGIGRRVLSGVAVGIELSGYWLGIRGYDSGSAVGSTIGVLIEPQNSLSVGAVWRNLNRPRLIGYADRIDESLTVGAAVRIRDEGVVIFDIVQEPRHEAEYRFGAEARVHRNLRLQVGTRLEPMRPSAGMQIHAGRWSFHYAGDLHPDLGASHELGLSVRLRK